MDSILTCKFVFTETNGYCLTEDDFKKQGDKNLYVVPQLNIGVNSFNLMLFKKSNHKFFYAVQDDNNLYHLKPIRNEQVKNLKGKEAEKEKKSIFYEEDENEFGSGTFGIVSSYPTENVVSKSFKKTFISRDFVKEISVYRLFKEFTCLPHFYNFLFTPIPTIIIEKGVVVLSKFKMSFDVSKSVSFQLVKCLKMFNSQGLIHLDLKPANIIVSNLAKDDEKEPKKITGATVQIIDWGICEIDHCPSLYQNDNFKKQSLPWRSPEILKQINYNYKADVFSLGIMFFEFYVNSIINKPFFLFPSKNVIQHESNLVKYLLDIPYEVKDFNMFSAIKFRYPLHNIIKVNLILNFGYYFDIQSDFDFTPFHGLKVKNIIENDDEHKLNILNELVNTSFPNLNEEQGNLLDLVSHMLEFNPDFRYSYDDIVLHPYFQNIKRQSHPPFPIFLNKIPETTLNYISKDENKDGGNLKFKMRNELIDSLVDQKINNEAKFLTIQLFDILNSKNDISIMKFDYNFDICYFISQCIYPTDGAFPVTEKSTHAIEENMYPVYDADITKILKLLKGNMIYPSIYSYYIYYKKQIPTDEILLTMFEFYKNKDCYKVDFKDVIEF